MSETLKEMLRDVSSEELNDILKEAHPSLVAEKDEEETDVTTTESDTPIEEPADSKEETKVLSEAAELLKTVKEEQYKARAETAIADASKGLPQGVVNRLRAHVEGNKITSMETLTETIESEREVYKDLMEARLLPPMRDFVVEGDDAEEKSTVYETRTMHKAMVGLLSGKANYEGVRAFANLKEAFWHYKQAKGETVNMFSGADIAAQIIREASVFDPTWSDNTVHAALAEGTYEIREAITSTSFSVLLGDAMHKVFLDSYAELAARFGDWRKLVSSFPVVTDFKNHHWTRRGVYNSLPSVAQGGTYQALTSPGEEDIILAVIKYGGTEDLTMEAVANDDLNALRAIPRDLAAAAAIGRHRAIFDLFTVNSGNGATMDYDTTALFDATHNNRATVALSSDEMHTAAMAMLSNTALSASQATLFVKPKYVLVPTELDRIANQMWVGDFELEPGTGGVMNVNPVKGLAEPITIPYWTDADNWYLVADPAQADTIAFAVLSGHEEPMIVMQDDPGVGSVFTADKITIKVRDVRDQDVLDHRSFYGEVV